MSEAAINDLTREIRFLPGFLRDPDAEALLRVCAEKFAWDRSIPDRPFARFGVPYGDDENREVVVFHPEVEPLLSRIEEEFGFRPDSCSVHWYLRGESFMGFHSDNIEDIADGTGVIIFSLGAARVLRFRWKQDPSVTRDFLLESGSLLFMSRALQEDWKHGVPRQPDTGERMSLVFRKIPR
jgi:hypothetical protein